jgi:Raf kinase inhibitor-like YbhB/YbcL family protein
MTRRQIISIFIIAAAGVAVTAFFMLRSASRIAPRTESSSANQENMKITSSAFGHNQPIPPQYTCDGADMNPPLSVFDVPQGTKSLVLIVDDPDAPTGDWVHWLVWNIDPSVTGIAENSVPSGGVEGTTDFNRTGWGGPCPPSGTHRYHFKIFALDAVLDLDPSARKADLERAMQGRILDQGVLIGTYERNRQGHGAS